MDINREDLAWAAGLFEGEGSFCVRQHNGRVLSVFTTINTYTDLPILKRFYEIVGLGKILGPYTRFNKEGKPLKTCWSWRAESFEHAQAVMVMLWPWLGERRKSKAKECFTKFHARVLQCGKGIPRKRTNLKIHTSEILALLSQGITQSAIAVKFNASTAAISRICSGKYNRAT